jgi:Lactonase, 7-bladed beta-propeller
VRQARHHAETWPVEAVLNGREAIALAAVWPLRSGDGSVPLVVDIPSNQFVYVASGITNRNITVVYVANETSSNVTAYAVNARSGTLTQLSGSPFATGTSPQSVAPDISGQYLYVANQISNNVWVYTIDPITGAISPVSGSPFAAGTNQSGSPQPALSTRGLRSIWSLFVEVLREPRRQHRSKTTFRACSACRVRVSALQASVPPRRACLLR